LPQRPDGGTMQHVTASQASFSNVIGEPGHTKLKPLDYARA